MTDKKAVADLAREALEVLKAHFGDRVSAAGGSFGATSATLKFEFAASSSQEDQTAAVRAKFNEACARFGLEASDFDLPLVVNGRSVTLTALHLGRPTYPFTGKAADGTLWKFGPNTFLIARGKRAAS